MKSFFLSFVFFALVPMFNLAAAGAPGGEPPSGAAAFMQFLPLIAIVAIFYFLILRPQNKKQKETQKMLSALKKGDKVITIGGIHGTIQTVRENTVILKVDSNTKLEFTRGAVASVEVSGKDDNGDKKTDDTEEKED